MTDIEMSIWAAMLGALLTFSGAALTDAVRNPTLAAWRGLGYVVLTGTAAVVMSGWVEHIAQIQDKEWLLPAKVALGPLSGALALLYMGIWFGNLAQDLLLYRLIQWGSIAQCFAAAVLLIVIVLYPQHGQAYLIAALAVNLGTVIMALMASARGIALGDRLASAMLFACLCLGMMVIGLYAKALGWASSNLLWALTAFCTVVHFLITTVLTIMRNSQLRLIKRMSEGVAKTDETTGLPVGGTLLSKIDDAIWRSVRIECECVVMAIWIDNLFAYNDHIDHSIEHEIRHILAARIRRAIGFRHTLGLQQSRCFVAGISAVGSRQRIQTKSAELVKVLKRSMQVGVMLGQGQVYEPKIGIGLVFVGLGHMTDPLSAMDHAQSLAKRALREESCFLLEEAHPTSYVASHKSAPASTL